MFHPKFQPWKTCTLFLTPSPTNKHLLTWGSGPNPPLGPGLPTPVTTLPPASSLLSSWPAPAASDRGSVFPRGSSEPPEELLSPEPPTSLSAVTKFISLNCRDTNTAQREEKATSLFPQIRRNIFFLRKKKSRFISNQSGHVLENIVENN